MFKLWKIGTLPEPCVKVRKGGGPEGQKIMSAGLHLPTFFNSGMCGRGLGAYASSVSFGHAEHCFLTVWTPKKFMSEFAEDDFS